MKYFHRPLCLCTPLPSAQTVSSPCSTWLSSTFSLGNGSFGKHSLNTSYRHESPFHMLPQYPTSISITLIIPLTKTIKIQL